MTDRERWIVYPLLFFALLMGIRIQLVTPDDIRCEKVTCQELRVRDLNGQLAALLIGGRTGGAEFMLFSPGRQVALQMAADANGDGGSLEWHNGHGETSGRLGSQDGGGYLKLLGEDDIGALVLGHDLGRTQSGLTAETVDGGEIHVNLTPPASDATAVPWGVRVSWPPRDMPDAARPAQ